MVAWMKRYMLKQHQQPNGSALQSLGDVVRLAPFPAKADKFMAGPISLPGMLVSAEEGCQGQAVGSEGALGVKTLERSPLGQKRECARRCQ